MASVLAASTGNSSGSPGPSPSRPRLREAALLLAQLSPQEAGRILEHLRPHEVQQLTTALVDLDDVHQGEVDAVMIEFHGLMHRGQFYRPGDENFIRGMLTAGFGAEDAEGFLTRLKASQDDGPFASMRNADVRQLATFLRTEHPQLIALVLAHLPATQAAEVLASLSPEQQPVVAHRIGTMAGTPPATAQLVEDGLRQRMGSLLGADLAASGGIEALVAILNRASGGTERSILHRLEEAEPELAAKVRARLFIFDDIVIIEDRTLQQVLREIRPDDLAPALIGVRPEVQEKVTRNLSARVAERLTEEIELLGPVRMRVVEEAQTNVVRIIRDMEAAGTLTIRRDDGELIP